MSDWIWRVIALKAAFALTCFVCNLRADDAVQKLPFCKPTNAQDSPIYNDLVIVSTLDGRLTAFSTQNGAKAWDLETQPLLSSNLHHVELTSGGKWVRLVPSLRGTLYSLSGDTIEPLPFDAEQLLSSTFKYSDDLVVAGARETLWFGLDSNTGSVIYECGSSGCNSEQQRAGAGRDVLVLRRLSSTVRALDPRTGTEKWNFSVAEHEVAVSRRECVGPRGGTPVPVHVSVGLHEGLVALANAADRRPLWQRKLDAPVAGMWRLYEGSLHNIDVMWEATQTLIEGGVTQQPSLYIGSHQRQLYIQESRFYARKLETAVATKPVPWKLVTARPLIGSGGDNGDTALTVKDPDSNKLSLITLYGNTGPVVDHGFFLYIQDTCDQAVQVTEDAINADSSPNNSNEQSDYHHIHVHVYSLWFWWKEVLLIAVSSALLMNLMIWPRFFARKLPVSPLPISTGGTDFNVVKYRHVEKPPSLPEYSGRYEMDFTPLRCLGKGGFGVVFEARNNIDHCSYAVKRITLPKDESKRERVLREVRALAKLEHEHIVRYFNAWVEQPPPLWQQNRDRLLMQELGGVSVAMSEEYTPTNSHPVKNPRDGSVTLNLHKCEDDILNQDLENKIAGPKRLRSLSCNDSISIIFDENASKPHLTDSSKTSESPPVYRHTTDEDSYIVFAEPDNSGAVPDEDAGGSPGEPSEAKNNSSFDKRLERVKQCDGFEVDSSTPSRKKKKGHTRHWSLDTCVRSVSDSGAPAPDMFLYIQMQLCLSDSLHDWLRNNRTCEARAHNAKNLFSQIVSAVEYVHLAGLIHRDLKPSNILFAPDGRVKVGDFGLVTHIADTDADVAADAAANADGFADTRGAGVGVRHAQHRHTYRVGTHLYMSPEQLQGRRYGYKVDIYSLGIILFELLQPFGTEAERVSCLMRLRDQHYPQHFHEKYPNEVGLLKMMLSEDPRKRPTASGVRARAPLFHCTDTRYHFTLPPAPPSVPALPTAPVTA